VHGSRGGSSVRGLAPVSLLILICICTLTGCRQSPANSTVQPVYDKATGRLDELHYDANRDGVTETVGFLDGRRIQRVEIDQDEDGRVDRWEYYDAAGALTKVGFSRRGDGREDAWSYADADGNVIRIEMGGAGGGIVRTEYYDHETITRADEDSDGDGAVDKWESYDAGRLASVAFDSARTGRADRRLTYESNGRVRIEADPDGDGIFSPHP
jgi:hypothetical protein